MNFKKRAIYFFLAFIMAFNVSITYAENINELKGRQKNIKEQINEKKNEIEKNQQQTNTVNSEIKTLDEKLNKATEELNQVEDDINKLENNMKKTKAELAQAEQNIEEKQDTFNKRLRVMYKTGNAGYIEILLSSDSISDFLSRQDMLKSIAKHDTELIEYMKEQRDIIDKRKLELSEQKTKLEVSKDKLEVKSENLAEATSAKQELMDRLKEDHIALEEEYDRLNDFAKEVESKILNLQVNTSEYGGGAISWPVPGHNRISSPFGYRIHPILKTKKFHSGIDIPAPTGSDVIAGESGVVIHSGNLGGYGKVIMVDHGSGIVTLYAHNSRLVARKGQNVSKGDIIAKIGTTGMSTGPHSHFEVRKNGSYENPVPWVKGN